MDHPEDRVAALRKLRSEYLRACYAADPVAFNMHARYVNMILCRKGG